MKTSFLATLAVAAALGLGSTAWAQSGHDGHSMGAGQGQPAKPSMMGPGGMGDMHKMMGAMHKMMPMMERMQSAPPAERDRMMGEMRAMMREMMPMMQGMMGAPAGGGTDHQGHGQPAAAPAPSTQAFEAANDRMHKDMAIAFTGNADVDFVRGMIPHHQGAIDMAKVVLEHGKDEWVKKLAAEVIAAQTKEIADMREWLAKNAR